MANPIAAATHAPAALLVPAAAGTTPYVAGIEQRWRCVEVDDEALALDRAYVEVDDQGKVVVDNAGKPFGCRPPAQAAQGRSFPIEILLGTVGLAGLIAAASGGGTTTGGGNDSPG